MGSSKSKPVITWSFTGTFAVPICLTATMCWTGCSNSEFSGSNKTRGTPTPPPIPEQFDAVKVPKVVFAVRDIGCAMCHATVDSDIITDMMAGSDAYTEHQALESWLHGYVDTPNQTISGTVFVPRATIRHDGPTVKNQQNGRVVTQLKFDDIMKNAIPTSVDILATMNQFADPYISWGPDSRHFEAVDRIEITPPVDPAELDVLTLANNESTSRDGIVYLNSFRAAAKSQNDRFIANQTGIQAQSNRIEITGDVTCEGAMIVSLPVFIHDATINTTEGCRIHSKKSIFIHNGVTVKSTKEGLDDDAAALMLLSPNFIGLHVSLATIHDSDSNTRTGRLNHSSIIHRSFRAGKPVDILSRILADHTSAAIPTDFTDGGTINYSRIALVAPIVYSKTKGAFSGTIVAEQFIGALGALSFKFDPVLAKAPFFPELIIDARDGKNIVNKGDVTSGL